MFFIWGYAVYNRYTQTWGQFNSGIGIGIDCFGIGIGIDYFGIGIGIEVCHKKLNPQINHYHLYLLFYLFY
jgi:hypothetical protein